MQEQRRVVEANCAKLDMDLKAAMHQLQLCPVRCTLYTQPFTYALCTESGPGTLTHNNSNDASNAVRV